MPTNLKRAALLLALLLAFMAGMAFENTLHRDDVAYYQHQVDVLSQALETSTN